jgi:hypothetical protein
MEMLKARSARRLGIAPLAIVAVFGMLTGPVRPATAELSRRVETATYTYGGGDPAITYADVGAGAATTVAFPGGRENQLSLTIDDASGADVVAKISQLGHEVNICSSTDQPILIQPQDAVVVELYQGRCVDGTPSVVTTGKVKAVFSHAPPGPRTETRDYSSTSSSAVVFDFEGNVYPSGAQFLVGDERWVRPKVRDEAGIAMNAVVLDGDSTRVLGHHCPGTRDLPIRVKPHSTIYVAIGEGGCDDQAPPAVPTKGSINATFTARP